jgi:hypothetical protein
MLLLGIRITLGLALIWIAATFGRESRQATTRQRWFNIGQQNSIDGSDF